MENENEDPYVLNLNISGDNQVQDRRNFPRYPLHTILGRPQKDDLNVVRNLEILTPNRN
jgi:hypothetical protein